MVFFAIIFSPFFIIYMIICICCKIKWEGMKYESRINNNSNNNNDNNRVSPIISRNNNNYLPNYYSERTSSEINILKEDKTERVIEEKKDYEDDYS